MEELRRKLEYVVAGGEVSRFHAVRTLQGESVAEHSFYVAMFVWLLTEGRCDANLLMAALSHDLAEQEVGDLPAPTKRALGVDCDVARLEREVMVRAGMNFDLPAAGRRVLKLADVASGMMLCIRERMLGNKLLGVVYQRYSAYAAESVPSGQEKKLFLLLDELWSQAQNES